MVKNNKGITIITLVVTIIVMLILASVTIVTTTDLLHSSRMKNYITIMHLIKVEAEKAYEEYQFDNDEKHLTMNGKATKFTEQVPLSSIEKTKVENEMNMSGVENAKQLWYKWNKEILTALGIDASNMINTSNDYFIVNYATGEVVYNKGYTRDGITTYSLTGLLDL